MDLKSYDGKRVALTDIQGNVFEGICEYINADYCEHEYGCKEEGLRIVNFIFFNNDIDTVECLEDINGMYGGFSAPYGLIEELNIKDAIDLQEELFCEENVHVYRMLVCMRNHMNCEDICEYFQLEEVVAILKKLSAMKIDDYILTEVEYLLKLARDMQRRQPES